MFKLVCRVISKRIKVDSHGFYYHKITIFLFCHRYFYFVVNYNLLVDHVDADVSLLFQYSAYLGGHESYIKQVNVAFTQCRFNVVPPSSTLAQH